MAVYKTSATPDPAWADSASHDALIPLDASTIHVRIAGPPRTSSTALVILLHGHASSLDDWSAGFSHISHFTRVLSYSRAGYGRSILTPASPVRTILNLCHELHEVLQAIGQAPPYVLVGHSLGGIMARAYLEQWPQEVAGLVLVDSYCVGVPPPLPGLFEAMVRPTRESVSGTDEAAASAESESFRPGAIAVNEAQGFYRHDDGTMGYARQPLEGRLSVVAGCMSKDLTRMLETAKTEGYGTEEQREALGEWAKAWSKVEGPARASALMLSAKSRLVQGEETHDVQQASPALVAQEVRWVLGMDDEP